MNQGFVYHKELEYYILSESTCSKVGYAAAELRKYIYQLTGKAAKAASEVPDGQKLTFMLQLNEAETGLGEEGYEINTTEDNRFIVISADNPQGILYGVYGLLDDHYGIGFYFSGDAIPQEKKPLQVAEIHERKIPRQYIRGVLPWTNFPQSATSYSTQDWIYMIDQMTRMRMNFINIHNYNGEFGHNEVFHNIMLGDKMSRNWNATASKPHAWGLKGWDVNEYLFGASDLFDDYDFGTDATLHNDYINNIDVFKKGLSQFQFILRYAHQKGVKIGLGLDLNLVMTDYQASADQDEVALARVNQIITDYPNLDYLMLYRSENSPNFDVWNKAFRITYETIKQKAANIRITVSGWGLDPDTLIRLPKDVIAAPISGHSVNDTFADGCIYGEREFWACPWSERDYVDSVHFAPYHTLLSNTIRSYQNRSVNTKGLMTLTWRVTDGVDAKLSYIAKAPWDMEERLISSEAAYHAYAKTCYGMDVADRITGIINQNEAYATNASECMATPEFSNTDRSADIQKANQQLEVIDSAIAITADIGKAERLNRLRSRIQSAKSFCIIDQNFNSTEWDDLAAEFRIFVENFTSRIDDISSLGNVISIENRYVLERYLRREQELRNAQTVKAPSAVAVKSTKTGARMTWKNEQESAAGYYIYRNGVRLNTIPVKEELFEDICDGAAVYRITAVTEHGEESVGSIPVTCGTGESKCNPIKIVMISPPTIISAQNFIDIKAIALTNTVSEQLTAMLYYREIGELQWQAISMCRRIKGIFGIRLDAAMLPHGDMEYYIEISDGKNTGYYPNTAPDLCSMISVVQKNMDFLSAPALVKVNDSRIYWTPVDGKVHWYRIYRGMTPDFIVGPQSLVTYVYRDTLSFRDTHSNFDGNPLCGKFYYKVTAVDIDLTESAASNAMLCEVKPLQKYDILPYLFHSNASTMLTMQNNCLHLRDIDFGNGEYQAIHFDYASTGAANIAVWIDSDNAKHGTQIGCGKFSTSGGMKIEEIGEVAITNIRGMHNIFILVSIEDGLKCRIDRLNLVNQLSEEVIITTDRDTFATGAGQRSIQLHANQDVVWEVKELDGTSAATAEICNGELKTSGNNNLRAVARSEKGIVGERLITAVTPVVEDCPEPFFDFMLSASFVGKDENIEIGGLVYGYDYACRVIDADETIYESDYQHTMSFKIPSSVLIMGHHYYVFVAAKDKDGFITEVKKEFSITDKDVIQLNKKEFFGKTTQKGKCNIENDASFPESGSYEMEQDGIRISTQPNSTQTGISFLLHHFQISKTPFILIKAELISGDWTIQVNGIPIVGQKENNAAIRKDLRLFGLEDCNTIRVTLIVNTTEKDQIAETIFRSVQLLPMEP